MIVSRPKNRWPLVPLSTLAEFRNGVNFSKANFGSGIKVIGVGDFQNNVRASFDNLEQINPEGVVRKEHLLKNGDILFVRSNGNRELIGRSMFVDGLREDVTHSAFSIRLRFISDTCLPRFYAYLFRSRLIRQALSLHGGGTNISNLNQDILGRLEVPLPPKPVQYKISSILAAYDDLIENNTRRIKILEGMAKMIYREWFVNFRFPGHERVEMVESEAGLIPEGWSVEPLEGNLSVLETGNRPKGGIASFSEGVPSIGAESISGVGRFDYAKTRYVPVEYFDKMNQGVLQDRDVLVYKDGGQPGNFHPHVSLVGDGFPFSQMVINSHVYRLRTTDRTTQDYLYYHLSSDETLKFDPSKNLLLGNKGVADPDTGLNTLATFTVTR